MNVRLSVKRVFDVVISAGALIALSPLIGAISLATLYLMGRPVLFRQPRGSLDGRTIQLVKFRTMTNDVDSTGRLLPDECRMTQWGKFLRKYSFDELPQLWNVLTGDISLVGPRPLLAIYTKRYNAFQRKRLNMRSGITGLAQVYGRNALTWEEKFRMDVEYVQNWTLTLDIKILIVTLLAVVRPSGVSSEAHATMPEFFGSTDAQDNHQENS